MAAPVATAAPGEDPKRKQPSVSPDREFVSGGTLATGVGPLRREALALAIDDIERDFGTTTYEKMMRDPAVYGSVETLKTLALSEDLRIEGAVTDSKSPDFKESERLRQFVGACLEGIATPLQQVLHEMLDALWRGSYVAEKVLRAEPWEGQVHLMLDKIKPKHPARTAYICDRFMNVLGIGVRDIHLDGATDGLPVVDGIPSVPREQFFVLRFWSVGGDPRGLSILRPAYNAWYLRQQTWPAFLRYLVQFATPSLIGTTPEGEMAKPDLDDDEIQLDGDGNVVELTPEEAMRDALLAFQGGTAVALKGGSAVQLIESKGEGQAFREAMELFKREIVLAILRVTRATMESQHGSKADAEVAQDVLGIFVGWIRRILEDAFDRDVIRWLIEINFGRDALKLAPKAKLSAAEKQDRAAVGEIVAKLFSADYFHSSQIPGLDALMEWPERDFEAWVAERQEAADNARMQAQELSKLKAPGAEEDDEEEQ